MIAFLHRCFSAALIALVMLTSVQAAAARAAPHAVGSIELCLGQTVVVVAVDADGAPVSERVHLCPDVALSLFSDIGLTPSEAPATALCLPLSWAWVAARNDGRSLPASRARGPPFAV